MKLEHAVEHGRGIIVPPQVVILAKELELPEAEHAANLIVVRKRTLQLAKLAPMSGVIMVGMLAIRLIAV
jgi:hypothetical protein